MAIPTWSVGEVLASADVNSWFVPLIGYKASDTSRSSTTSQTNDPDLIVAVAANAVYYFDLWLNYEGSTQGSSDLKLGMAVPASATLKSSASYVNSSGGSVVEVYYNNGAAALVPGTNGAGNIRGFYMKGTVAISSTSGNVALSWAQNTSSGTATVLHAGSALKLRRIG